MSRDFGLLLLRVGAGCTMAFAHGFGKVSQMVAGNFGFADPIGIGPVPSLILAALAESACALAVAAGLWTRLAAIPPAAVMLVAAWIVHAGDPWGKKELAVLYLVAFATLALTGGGRFTLDALWTRRKPKRAKK